MAVDVNGNITDLSGNPTGGKVDVGSGQIITPTSVGGNSTSDALLSELQARLMGSAGSVSSDASEIDKTIEGAITNLQRGTEKAKAGVTSSFDRAIEAAKTEGAQALTSFSESTRGFATNTAALKQLQEQTEKSVRDLDTRKQEALLNADANMYNQLTNLQLQQLQFKQQAQQQVFSNLLSVAGFAQQERQFAQSERQFERTQSAAERAAISNIALQYGVEVKAGDTLDTITARAQPFASEQQKLELEKTRAEIARSKAEAAKAMRGENVDKLDPNMIDIIARAANLNPAVLGLLKDPGQAGQVITKMAELNQPRAFSSTELQGLASEAQAAGKSFQDSLADIARNPMITNKAEAERVLRQAYGQTSVRTGGVLTDFVDLFMGEGKNRREAEKRYTDIGLSMGLSGKELEKFVQSKVK